VADHPDEDPPEVLCLTCLRRPSRPGSVYCSALCRVLHALRLTFLGLVLPALALGLVACSTSTTSTRPPPAPRPLSCAWYTPTTPNGQQVIVTATGPACGSPALIEQVARMSKRTWLTEGLALVPHTSDDLFSQVARAGSVVKVWFTGNDPPTLTTAGLLSDDLQAAGWTPQLPQA
jgi:hypothetical protein